MRLFHPLKTAMATRGAGPAVAGAARAGPAGLRPPAPFSAVAVTATRFPHHPRHDALVPPGGRGSHARPAWLRAPSTSQYRWMSDKVRAHWQPLIPSTTTSRLLEHLNLSTWGTRESPRAYASHPTRGPQGGEAGGITPAICTAAMHIARSTQSSAAPITPWNARFPAPFALLSPRCRRITSRIRIARFCSMVTLAGRPRPRPRRRVPGARKCSAAQ